MARVCEGRLNLAVDFDLQKPVGVLLLAFHANVFQIHGEGLSRNNFFVVPGIEACLRSGSESHFRKTGADKVAPAIKPGRHWRDAAMSMQMVSRWLNRLLGQLRMLAGDIGAWGGATLPSGPSRSMGSKLNCVRVADHIPMNRFLRAFDQLF